MQRTMMIYLGRLFPMLRGILNTGEWMEQEVNDYIYITTINIYLYNYE